MTRPGADARMAAGGQAPPTFAEQVLAFNAALAFPAPLSAGVAVMNPFSTPFAKAASEAFYTKYYNDTAGRHLILGINPGRFGAGLTGVPFTDPKRLATRCGIHIPGAPAAHEPSSVFVYEVIAAYGGEDAFYRDWYVTSICPLGFTTTGAPKKAQAQKDGNAGGPAPTTAAAPSGLAPAASPAANPASSGSPALSAASPAALRVKNANYYDFPALAAAAEPFMVASLRRQLAFGLSREACVIFGHGKNAAFIARLNTRHHFFKRLIPLPHPRFVAQYKWREREAYVKKYLDALAAALF